MYAWILDYSFSELEGPRRYHFHAFRLDGKQDSAKSDECLAFWASKKHAYSRRVLGRPGLRNRALVFLDLASKKQLPPPRAGRMAGGVRGGGVWVGWLAGWLAGGRAAGGLLAG